MSADEFSYQTAVKEIETIIAGIEREELDVDQLNEKVKKALILLKKCKQKLKNTEDELNKNLEELL